MKDPIITWADLYNDEGVILLKPFNAENPLRSLSAFLVATPTIGPWNLSATTGFQKTWLQVGDIQFNDAPIWIAQTTMFVTKKGTGAWLSPFAVTGSALTARRRWRPR